ncbi:hypothetical protein LDENG_00025550 [Lucifuga dentata]|nr:hypothetical protein LDENG_00025550 [Lucifuga dentata]
MFDKITVIQFECDIVFNLLIQPFIFTPQAVFFEEARHESYFCFQNTKKCSLVTFSLLTIPPILHV